MLIIFIELYFIIKRILLRYEFQKHQIKDRKYTSALYRFYVYSKYHSKNSITDFIGDFKRFYELDNLDRLDDEYKEFNVNRTVGFSRDISALSYKKQLGTSSSNANPADLQNDIINNLEQLNLKLNNIQDSSNFSNINNQVRSNSNVIDAQEEIRSTIVSNRDDQEERSKKSSSNINTKIANSEKEDLALEKKKEKIIRKQEKKESKENKESKESKDSSPYFNENDSVVKVKQSKKDVLAMEREKKDKAALKKLMSDI